MNDNLGQYFTTDNGLKRKMLSFILNNPKRILEPCIGRGNEQLLYNRHKSTFHPK